MTEETKETSESKELTTAQKNAPIAPFASITGFEAAQRVAKALMTADMAPQQYRGNIGNTMIAMELANRTGSSIMAIMQNLNVIHGKPSFSSSYCIAALNQSGRFVEPIHFNFQGEEDTDSWGCRAVGITKLGTEIRGPLVTIKMAKAEGWYGRGGSKWKTMPELMLTYRAAAFFARTVDPGLLMGMQTQEELTDITPRDNPISLTSTVVRSTIAPGKIYVNDDDDPIGPESSVVRDVIDSGGAKPGRVINVPDGHIHESEVILNDGEVVVWPKWDNDRQTWFDSDGVYYDVNAHASFAGREQPSTNADGAFKARRGHAHKAQALAEAAKRAEPVPPLPDTDTPEPPKGEEGSVIPYQDPSFGFNANQESNSSQAHGAGEDQGEMGAPDDGRPETAPVDNGAFRGWFQKLKSAVSVDDLDVSEKELESMKREGLTDEDVKAANDAFTSRYREMKASGAFDAEPDPF